MAETGQTAPGWFTEEGVLNSSNVKISIRMDEQIDQRESKFQKIQVFNKSVYRFVLVLPFINIFVLPPSSEVFGRCLVLDDAIQCTELDEAAYQEMIAFLPLNAHPNPKRVLIIGGGDGGVAREVAKHPLVEEIVQCEIDEEVVKVAKQHLPFMAAGFDNAKVRLLFADGYKYVLEHKNQFDVIITDSSDPKGPAVTLFESDYYRALFECLRPEGIICCQAESYWFDLDFIRELVTKVRAIFPSVAYATTSVASYPSGQIGFLLASKNAAQVFNEPITKLSADQIDEMKLKYYSPQMHQAAFVLPVFLRKVSTASTECSLGLICFIVSTQQLQLE